MKKIGCEGCTKLKYLESTGTQYINTQIIPLEKFKSIIEFETKNNVSSTQEILGVSQYGNSKILYATAWESGKFYFGYGANSNDWYWAGYNILANTRYKVESDLTNGLQKHFINDNLIIEKNNTTNVAWTSSLYLFAKHGPSKTEYLSIIKLYSCKIYNDDVLVRDYIPVLDANDRPCLFDKVSKTCFYNQGTGEFLYG